MHIFPTIQIQDHKKSCSETPCWRRRYQAVLAAVAVGAVQLLVHAFVVVHAVVLVVVVVVVVVLVVAAPLSL